MNSVDVRVTPVAAGWMVDGPPGLAPLVFRSGGHAEAKAERLARAMTAAGVDVRVVIFNRMGTPVGTRRFWAQSADLLAQTTA